MSSNAVVPKGTADNPVPTVDLTTLTKRDAGKVWTTEHAVDVIAAIRESGDQVRKAGEGVMFAGALAFHNLTNVSGLAGKDSTVTVPVRGIDGKVRDIPLTTQGNVAAAMGFSKSYGTELARLSRAIFRHGVQSGSSDWTLLTGSAGDAWVGKLLPAKDEDALTTPDFKA